MVNSSSCDSGSNLSPKNEFRLQYLQITSLSVQKSKFSAAKTALFSFQNRDVAGMRGAFFRGVVHRTPRKHAPRMPATSRFWNENKAVFAAENFDFCTEREVICKYCKRNSFFWTQV